MLGRLHLATGYSVVALTGALTWQTIADTTPDTRDGWLQTIVWAGSLILLAFTATLVMWLGDPEQAISGTTDYAWHVVLPHLSRWLVIVSGGAVLLSCGLLASTRPRALVMDLDRYARFLPLGSTLTILPLFVVCIWLGRRTVGSRSSTTPPPFRGYARGLASWAAASTGLFIGVGFCAAFDLGVAKLVGRPAQTDLVYRIAYAWGLTVCLILVIALVALPWWGRQRGGNIPGVGLAYERVDTSTGLSDRLPGGWDRSVASAIATAQGKLHVAGPVIVFAVAGTVMSAITWMEMFHWHTPWPVAWMSHGIATNTSRSRDPPGPRVRGALQHRHLRADRGGRDAVLARPPGPPHRADPARRERRVGRDLLLAALRAPVRAAVVRAVRRARPAAPDPVPPRTPARARPPRHGPDGGGAGRRPAIVVSAHSQGSLIAFATMLWLGEHERRRIALVTYGSQLQVAFPARLPGVRRRRADRGGPSGARRSLDQPLPRDRPDRRARSCPGTGSRCRPPRLLPTSRRIGSAEAAAGRRWSVAPAAGRAATTGGSSIRRRSTRRCRRPRSPT